jgi:hypothetical protein
MIRRPLRAALSAAASSTLNSRGPLSIGMLSARSPRASGRTNRGWCLNTNLEP